MDTPESPPIETVEISKLFCSPTNPRRNEQEDGEKTRHGKGGLLHGEGSFKDDR